MASVSTYLNFPNKTEEVFNFYKTVFGTEFIGEVMRFGDMPPMEGMPPLPEKDKNLILHLALPITNGHQLMGSDAPESMGFHVDMGNNVHLNIQTDTRTESDVLFSKLSAGGKVTMKIEEQFWGDYYGSCTDKFGINWMVHTESKQ